MDYRAMGRFYAEQLAYDFLPYWFRFVDETHGGLCNCIANHGDTMLAGDKFPWDQVNLSPASRVLPIMAIPCWPGTSLPGPRAGGFGCWAAYMS